MEMFSMALDPEWSTLVQDIKMIIILCTLAILLVLLYSFLTWNHGYWAKSNIPYEKPQWFTGNYGNVLSGKQHYGELFRDMYMRTKHNKYVGYYKLSTPCILLNDLTLIKDHLTTDFSSFANNEFYVDPEVDPMFGYNPFCRRDKGWKQSRAHFTPSVTNSKVKSYFPGMEEVCKTMVKYIYKRIEKNDIVELETRTLAGKYTTDIIARVIFCMESNSFENGNTLMHSITTTIFENTLWTKITLFTLIVWPSLQSLLKAKVVSKESEKKLTVTSKNIINHRTKTGEKRNDFFQHMMNCRETDTNNVFTDTYIAAHTFGFVIDGYETSSTVIAMAIYELAWNPAVQEKLRAEINESMNETNGKLVFDNLHALKYLDMVIAETLRKYPPLLTINRICTKEFVLPASNNGFKSLKLDVGTSVTIPVYGLHYDPEYFPEPIKFDPERFSDEAVATRDKFCYLPFGEGPRICLGMRYAMTQTKASLASLIYNFRLTPSSRYPYDLKISPNIFIMRPENAWVKFERIPK